MKNIFFQTLIILGAMTLMAGCPPKSDVSTTMNPDGSISRMVTFQYDSAAIDYALMPVPVIPEKWQIMIIKDTTQDNTWKYQLETTFGSFQDMKTDYETTKYALDKLDHQYNIKRSFRWFYTFYEYTERYSSIFPPTDRQQFLTDEEWAALKLDDPKNHPIFAGMDSIKSAERLSTIEKNQQKHLDYSAATFVISRQLEGAKSLGFFSGIVTAQAIADSLLLNGYNWDFMSELTTDPAIFLPYFPLDTAQSKAIDNWVEKDSVFVQTMARHEQAALLTYTNHVELPGTLIATNAQWRNGNKLTWPAKMEFVATEDLTMYAETKVANTWAWIVSGLIVLIGLLLWVKRK